MKKSDRPELKEHAKWALGATTVVLVYFGAFAVLLFPAVRAMNGA